MEWDARVELQLGTVGSLAHMAGVLGQSLMPRYPSPGCNDGGFELVTRCREIRQCSAGCRQWQLSRT